MSRSLCSQRGDTLIEVTFALTILTAVLVGATAVATTAFRTGELAKERTQVSQEAQLQAEALRTFRDNHSWGEFRGTGTFTGVENVATHVCHFDPAQRCFSMAVRPGAGLGSQEWVPVSAVYTGKVQTSFVEIAILTPPSQRACTMTFEIAYWFTPRGGGAEQRSHITTTLANLAPTLGGCP